MLQIYELDDLLAALIRLNTEFVFEDDETVDVLKNLTEAVTLAEGIAVLTKDAHPIQWGAPPNIKWDFATWG